MLDSLSLDLVVEISRHLNIQSLAALNQVNRRLHNWLHREDFWRKLEPTLDLNQPHLEKTWPILYKYLVELTQRTITPDAIYCLDVTLILERCLRRQQLDQWNYFWQQERSLNYRRLAFSLVESNQLAVNQGIFREILNRLRKTWNEDDLAYFLRELYFISPSNHHIILSINQQIYPTRLIDFPPVLQPRRFNTIVFLDDPLAQAILADDDQINSRLATAKSIDWCQVAVAATMIGRKDLLKLAADRNGFLPFPDHLKRLADCEGLNLGCWIDLISKRQPISEVVKS